MYPEPFLDIALSAEEDDAQLHQDLKGCGAVWWFNQSEVLTEMNDATE